MATVSRPLIHDDFLLDTPLARALYHEIAAPLPIIDYHNHLDAATLANDQPFENVARLWITTDPYKHRAMRIAGIPEAQITGAAPDREKFQRWAETVPKMLGNPLYHWTALELKRYFDIEEPLNGETAQRIWDAANERLRTPELTPRGLLTRMNVACVCTSDRLLDDLSAHERLAASDFRTKVLPSLRADDIVGVDVGGFNGWAESLNADTLDDFEAAVRERIDAFDRLGCRLSDHAMDRMECFPFGAVDLDDLYVRRRQPRPPGMSADDILHLKSHLLLQLGAEYARREWIMQLHLGAHRNTSGRLLTLAGPAGGYATIGERVDVASLCLFLNQLETWNRLPRVILYNLNPADNAAMATLTGSYAEDGVPGKIQLGPAWWYNDHARGIFDHLDALASYGLLATFIGFTTDSRSLLSMTRHEYFRRLLCQWVARQVQAGSFPNDRSLLDPLIRSVCYDNAATYLRLNKDPHS